MKYKYYFIFCCFLCSFKLIHAQPTNKNTYQAMGFDSKKLSMVDSVILKAIANQEIPGAVISIVKNNKITYLKSYGKKSIYPKIEPMTTNTIFDLASLSKSVSTAICVMQLVENGKISLQDNVNKYIPNFLPYKDSTTTKHIKIIDLLTHSSGLPPYLNVDSLVTKYGSPNPIGLMDSIALCKRNFAPETKFQYSCLNFITLQHIIEIISGELLSLYAKKHIFDVLGMKHTTYNPADSLLKYCAPTEVQKNGELLLGKVHDPLARIMNDGNSGNAGLFSNAEDLSILAIALMNNGSYRGKRLLGRLTLEKMISVSEPFILFGRSLGWDNYSPYASNHGDLFPQKTTYGHTGYTGTSMFIDPINKVAVILLTNSVHPYGKKNSIINLRKQVANIVAGSIL